MEMLDHYATLNLPHGATFEQIKKSYRKLAKELHPDATGNDPEKSARFAAVAEAYETLSDPERRSIYDAELRVAEARRQAARTYARASTNYQDPLSDLFGRKGPFSETWREPIPHPSTKEAAAARASNTAARARAKFISEISETPQRAKGPLFARPHPREWAAAAPASLFVASVLVFASVLGSWNITPFAVQRAASTFTPLVIASIATFTLVAVAAHIAARPEHRIRAGLLATLTVLSFAMAPFAPALTAVGLFAGIALLQPHRTN